MFDNTHSSEYQNDVLNGEKPRKRRRREKSPYCASSRQISIEIPEDKLNDVKRLLERLSMQDNHIAEQSRLVKRNEFQCEVKEIVAHSIELDKNSSIGRFRFLLRFKGYKTPEWIDDSECNCEILIRKYLREHVPHVRVAYGLCRVSSKHQTGPTHVSLIAQEKRIRETATLLELTKGEILRIKIFSIAASAYRGVPRQLHYIAECTCPRDILITYRVDRLSRNIVRFLSLLEDMDENGVLIYAQDENLWYHNRKLDFLQHILDANKEAAIISKRVRLSIEHRRSRGDYIGSAPYGFRLARNPYTKIVSKVRNMEEENVILRIKHLATYSEMEFQDIADLLNREGVKKRGRTWTGKMVRYVFLHN